MGRPKADLPFGTETMLARVVRRLAAAVEPVVVVAAVDQQLPDLPSGVLVARDRRSDRGPLEGIAVGLGLLRGRVEGAFVTGCDAPLLEPAFVRRMIALWREGEIAVPRVDGFEHPLAAVYPTSILPEVESLLAADRLSPALLFDRVFTRRIAAEELADVDPELASLVNVNSPEDYRAAVGSDRT
jgi:molybdopterin-guanine dinucleotide biosynthesis protein A